MCHAPLEMIWGVASARCISSANGCMPINTLLNSCATVAARRPSAPRRLACSNCASSIRRSATSRVLMIIVAPSVELRGYECSGVTDECMAALEKYKRGESRRMYFSGHFDALPAEGTTAMTMKACSSIRGKLTRMIMVTTTTAVVLACAGFMLQDVIGDRNELHGDMEALSAMIAANSNAALRVGDHSSGEEVLSSLRTRPSVYAGCIYNGQGRPFATYYSGPRVVLPARFPAIADGLVQHIDRVELFRSITVGRKVIGHLYIVSDLRQLHARLKQDAQFVAVILLVCLIVA